MTRAERYELRGLLDSAERMAAVARRVTAGALFVYPTETIYGIGGRGDSEAVRTRLVAAKSRDESVPLILVAADRETLMACGVEFPPAAERLAAGFWPGRVTLVLPVVGTETTLGVRVSDHPFIQALSSYCRFPLFSTSANLSGQPYRDEPDTIFETFAQKIDFMVDAGPLPPSLPSTVVGVGRDGRVEVLREGVVDAVRVSAIAAGNSPGLGR